MQCIKAEKQSIRQLLRIDLWRCRGLINKAGKKCCFFLLKTGKRGREIRADRCGTLFGASILILEEKRLVKEPGKSV